MMRKKKKCRSSIMHAATTTEESATAGDCFSRNHSRREEKEFTSDYAIAAIDWQIN